MNAKLLINVKLVAGKGANEPVPEASKEQIDAAVQAARLRYGCTSSNTHFMLVAEMPHGGLKRSGYGKDLSMYALEDYRVVRQVMVRH